MFISGTTIVRSRWYSVGKCMDITYPNIYDGTLLSVINWSNRAEFIAKVWSGT